MAEAIDTAFVDIRPDFSGFAVATERGIKTHLAGTTAGSLAVDSRGVRSANRELGALDSSLGRSRASAAGMTSQMALLGATASRAGTIAGAGVAGLGIAAALGIAKVTQASIEFETAFSGVVKTVAATPAQLESIKQGFIDLSTEIPVTASELARIGEAAGQLGIKTQAIDEFTETVANLGATTNLTSEVAADSLARIANITGLPQTKFENLGSTIVDLGNKLAATEAEIVEFGLRIAGAGTQVGLSEAEILSIGGALASVGLEAEAGGTAISTTLVKIASAVKGGGQKLQEFAKVAGVSGDEFRKKFSEDPAQALTQFIAGLGNVDKQGGNVFATLEKLGLGGIRVRDALLRSASAGDLMARSLKIGDKAWASNTALQREASIRYETTASKIQVLRNQVNALAIDLGDKLGPAVGEGAEAIGEGIAALRENQDVGDTISRGFDNLKSAVEPLFNVFRRNKDVIVDTFKNAGESIRVLSVLLKPVAVIVGATLVVAFESLFFSLDKVNKVSRLFGDIIKKSVSIAVNAIDAFLATVQFLVEAIDSIPGVDMSGTVKAIQGAREKLAEFQDDLNGMDGKTVKAKIEVDVTGAIANVKLLEGAIEELNTKGIRDDVIPNTLTFGITKLPKSPKAAGGKDGKGGVDFGPPLVDVPKVLQEKEQRLQDNLALAQALNESTTDDKEALGVLARFYEAQAANGRFALNVQRQFTVKAAQARQAIRNLDAQDAADAKADRDAAIDTAKDKAEEKEQARQAMLQANLRLAQASKETLKDDIKAQSDIVVDLKRQIRVAKDGTAAERALRAELRIEKGNLAALREQEAERKDALKLDAIRDQKTLASFTKGLTDDARALRAEERYWLKKVAGEKRGSVARRKYRIELERTRKEIRELRGEEADTDKTTKGTSIVDILTENAQAFARLGSNIGTAGIDPLSGFDANQSLAAMLRRQQQDPTAATRATDPMQGFQGGVDRLVEALDRNTKSRGGNEAATGDNGSNGQLSNAAVNALGQRGAAMARFWDSARARRIAEESTSG